MSYVQIIRSPLKTAVAAFALLSAFGGMHAAGADEDSGLVSWINGANRAVDQVMVYPSFAEKRGISGRSVFNVTIDRNGDVIDSKLIASSGQPGLRSAARRVIQRADFPALPSGYNQKQLRFSVQLNYLTAGSQMEARALKRATEVRGAPVDSNTLVAGKITILSAASE